MVKLAFDSVILYGFFTVTLHLAVNLLAVHVIVALPAVLAVTKPLEFTVATAVLDEVHFVVLEGPVTVAFNWSVFPLFNVAEVLFNDTEQYEKSRDTFPNF